MEALLASCAVNSSHKGQWRGDLICSLICTWINGWVNNCEAGDLRRHRAHYDVTVMDNYKASYYDSKLRFRIRFDYQKTSFKMSFKIHPESWNLLQSGGYDLSLYFATSINQIFCCWDRNVPRNVAQLLQWRHNERDRVSNDRHLDCFLNHLLRRRSKKTSKLRVTGLCEGNWPITGEFPAQRAIDAKNVSIWWSHRFHLMTSSWPWLLLLSMQGRQVLVFYEKWFQFPHDFDAEKWLKMPIWFDVSSKQFST